MSYFPQWRLKTDGIIGPDERLPSGQMVALGIQHVVAMFGSTILAPLLMGFDPNVAVLMSGIGTILFFLIVGGHVPSYLGSSFAFIGVVIAATGYVAGSGANANIPLALGGIITCGIIYAVVGLIVMWTGVAWIEKLMPPVVTGAVVAVIGLNLAPTAVRSVGGTDFDHWMALLTVLCVGGVAVYTRGLLQKLLILAGLVLAYFIYMILSNGLGLGKPIDFSIIANAAWIGLPQFHAPVFSVDAMFLIAPVVIILIAENLGHVKAVTAMTGKNLDPYMGRAFLGDGLATILAGSVGGTGVTTYRCYGRKPRLFHAAFCDCRMLCHPTGFLPQVRRRHSDDSAADSGRHFHRGLRSDCHCRCPYLGCQPGRFRRQPQPHCGSRDAHSGRR